MVSMCFTYIGLLMGKKINNLIGSVSTFIGGFVLIVIGKKSEFRLQRYSFFLKQR